MNYSTEKIFASALLLTLLTFSVFGLDKYADAIKNATVKMQQRNYTEARQLLERALQLPDLTPIQQLTLKKQQLNIYFRSTPYTNYRPVIDEYLEMTETSKLKPDLWTLNQAANKAIQASDFGIAEKCLRLLIATAPLHPKYPHVYLNAAAMSIIRGNLKQAETDLQQVIDNQKYQFRHRYIARIIQLAVTSKDAKAFRQGIHQLDKEFTTEKISKEERFKLLRRASAYLFNACRYDDVRALVAETKTMIPSDKKKTFTCHYVKNAPRSADSWLRSALLKDPRYRESRFEKYANLNDNLKSEIARLKNTENVNPVINKPGYETSVYIVYDKRGIHIFALCGDPEAEKIEQGLVKGGSLEFYFQPGKSHAYHQWFFNLPGTEEPHLVNWDAPHRNYRYTYDYMTKDTSITDTAIGAYTFIPWLLVYDKLPADSNKWIFSMQRWTKGGSVTLGGAVHELGRAVNLDFQMSKAQLLAVKREIISRAYAKYRQEREKREGVSIWNDPVLGDIEFYQKSVQPLLERLDQAGETVNKKMTDPEIELLFSQFVPQWMELSYEVAELRINYLKNKLLQEDK